VSWAGSIRRTPPSSEATSLAMSAMVRPARASESRGWRPAKAASSAKVTASTGDCGAAIVAAARASFAPQVRQPAEQPPGARGLVVVPALAVAHGALGQGVAVDDADLDVAYHVAIAERGAAEVAIAGNLHLLVAGEVDVAQRM